MPDFSLAAMPNFAQAALSGYRAGQAQGQQNRLDSALGNVDITRPETIVPVLQADPTTGAALLNASSSFAKAHATAVTNNAFANLIIGSRSGGGGQSTGAQGAPATPQASGSAVPVTPTAPSTPTDGSVPDVVVTGQRPAPQSGWSDDELTAIRADPQAFMQFQENRDKMSEQHLKVVQDAADTQAAVGHAALALPYAQRKAYIQQHAPMLLAHGVTQDQINSFDPTDQNIGALVTQSIGVKAALDQSNSDRTFAETQRQHGIENGLAAQRIGIEARNSNISAGHLAIAQRADARAAASAKTGGGGGANPGAIAAPTSAAEYNALPSGARYYKNGVVRIKS